MPTKAPGVTERRHPGRGPGTRDRLGGSGRLTDSTALPRRQPDHSVSTEPGAEAQVTIRTLNSTFSIH